MKKYQVIDQFGGAFSIPLNKVDAQFLADKLTRETGYKHLIRNISK